MFALAPILGVLGRIPFWVWPLAIIIGWGALGNHRASKLQTQIVNDRAVQAQAVAKTTAEYRAEEQRRTFVQAEIVHDKQKILDQARADRERSAGAERRLRAALAAARSGGAASSAASAASGPTVEAVADVLGSCITRYRELGEQADEARAAGSTCERAYDSLTKGEMK